MPERRGEGARNLVTLMPFRRESSRRSVSRSSDNSRGMSLHSLAAASGDLEVRRSEQKKKYILSIWDLTA